jgi:hypothetical protein
MGGPYLYFVKKETKLCKYLHKYNRRKGEGEQQKMEEIRKKEEK